MFEYINKCEEAISKELKKVDEVVFKNSEKVLNAFREENLSEYHFNE